MARTGRPVTKLSLTDEERAELMARLAVRKAPADEKLRMRAPQTWNIDHHARLILPVGQRLAVETRVVEIFRERHRIAFEEISDGVHADRSEALCHLRTDGRCSL